MNRLLGASAMLLILPGGCQSMTTTPSGSPVEEKMSVNGVSLTYIEQDQGAPVVFVHEPTIAMAAVQAPR